MLFLAFLIGFAAGLRSMTAPAAISWGARMGWLPLGGTGLAFFAHPLATIFFTLAMIGEFVGDKLPNTPARTAPPGFITRIVVGALCGAAIGLGHRGSVPIGAVLGVLGAVAGTLGGYNYRLKVPRAMRLAGFPFAVLEDLVAVGLAFFVASRTIDVAPAPMARTGIKAKASNHSRAAPLRK